MKASRLTIIELFLITTLIALLLAFGMHTHKSVLQYAFVLEDASDILLSPAADKVALAKGGQWEIYDAETGKLLSSATCLVAEVHFSPDGKWLVSDPFEGTPQIWDAATGAYLGDWMLTASESTVHSPDSSLLYVQGGGMVFAFEDASGAPASTAILGGAAISPDRNFFVVFNTAEQWRVLDTRNGKEHGAIPRELGAEAGPLFLPGVNVVCTVNNERIQLWDVEEGERIARIPRSGKSIVDIAASPSGAQLAVCDEDFIEVWDLAEKTKLHEFPLPGNAGEDADIAFMPDGKRLRIVKREYDPDVPGEYSSQVITIDIAASDHDVKTFAFSQRERFVPVGLLAGLSVWLVAWVAVAWRANREHRHAADLLAYSAVPLAVIYFSAGGLLLLPLVIHSTTAGYTGIIILGGGLLAILTLVLVLVLTANTLRRRPLLTVVSVLTLVVSVLLYGYHFWIITASFGMWM